MSAGCSTASQHTQSTEANVPPPPPNKKYSILVDMDGAKGKDATKWNSRCGALIRGHIPISYEDWRKIDDFYKDHLWKALMALIEAAEERQKSEASLNGDGEDGIISLDDFEKDPVAEVFGDNKRRSYCRAISSTANVKQVKLAQASKEIIGSKENAEKQWKMKMENNHNQMHEDLKSFGSVLSSIQQCVNQLVNRTGGNMTPTTEVASNAERATNSPVASLGAPSNGFKGSSTREKQSVILLSRELKEIAKGYLGTQKICHHREVVQGEKVVWMEEVLVLEAPIFEAPQNGNYTLSDIADGAFVICPSIVCVICKFLGLF